MIQFYKRPPADCSPSSLHYLVLPPSLHQTRLQGYSFTIITFRKGLLEAYNIPCTYITNQSPPHLSRSHWLLGFTEEQTCRQVWPPKLAMGWPKFWVSSCNIAIRQVKGTLPEVNRSSPLPRPTRSSKRNLQHVNGSATFYRLLVPSQTGPIISSPLLTGLAATIRLGSLETWSLVSRAFPFRRVTEPPIDH